MSAPGKLVRSSRWKSGPSKGQRPLGSECCVATGDSGCEAYTAIAWGVGLSHERLDIVGAESFLLARRQHVRHRYARCCRPAGVQGHITCKGIASEPGRSRVWPSASREKDGPHREGEEPNPTMDGHEKSDNVIVAMKPANKARKAHCGGVCGG